MNDTLELKDKIHDKVSTVKSFVDIIQHCKVDELEDTTIPTLMFVLESILKSLFALIQELFLIAEETKKGQK